jgi:uncharacterized membrane protein
MNFIAGVLISFALFLIHHVSVNTNTDGSVIAICMIAGIVMGMVPTLLLLCQTSKKKRRWR